MMTLRVGNRGPDAAGNAIVSVPSPFFVNFMRPVPDGCRLRLADEDPYVPEVLLCTVDGPIAPGSERVLDIPVRLLPGGPRSTNVSAAVAVPASPEDGQELFIMDNLNQANVQRLRDSGGEAPPAGNPVGVYLANDAPPVAVGTRTRTTLTVGNAGPNATTTPVSVVYKTPFFANLDSTVPLPPGCTQLLKDPAAYVPEIIRCTVPPGLRPGQERRVTIPVTMLDTGAAGFNWGFGLAAPAYGGADADPRMVDNVHPVSLLMMRGPDAPQFAPDSPGTTLAGDPPRLTAGAAPTTGPAADLSVAAASFAVTPGTPAAAVFTVANQGTVATRAAARLVMVSPFYSNIDRTRLPANCRVVASNPAPNVPEIAECAIPPGLAPDARTTVELPLDVLPGGPTGPTAGTAIVATTRPDAEAFMTDNVTTFTVQRPGQSTPPATGVDLWVTNDSPALAPDQPRGITLRYGNAGRRSTAVDSELVYVTPVYTNVDRTEPLPAGCRIQSPNEDPLIPEIVLCQIEPGLASGSDEKLTIPLRLLPGGPAGWIPGRVSLVPRPDGPSLDHELHYPDNMHTAPIIAIMP